MTLRKCFAGVGVGLHSKRNPESECCGGTQQAAKTTTRPFAHPPPRPWDGRENCGEKK